MEQNKHRIGFIGTGWHTTGYYMPLLKERQDVEMAAVCDKSSEHLNQVQRDFGIAFGTEDYRELLEQDLDAVFVGSPHIFHYEHARAALERGFHVLCEKPMTLRGREAHELVQRARERGVQLMLPCGWNFKPFVRKAKEWMEAGVTGEIECIQCHFASGMREFFVDGKYGPTWQKKEKGGGYAYGQLPHPLSMMLWLTGARPRCIAALTHRGNAETDLYDAVTIAFEGGAVGNISGAATLPEGTLFHLSHRAIGKDGVLILDAEGDRERLEVLRHDRKHRRFHVTPGEGHYNVTEGIHEFIELLNGNGRNCARGLSGALSTDILEPLLESSRKRGAWVSLPHP